MMSRSVFKGFLQNAQKSYFNFHETYENFHTNYLDCEKIW